MSKLGVVSVFAGMLLLNVTVSQAAWKGISDESAKILALEANLEHGATLYEKNCVLCHEMEGWGSIYGGDFPQLAGQHQSVVLKQLLDMRDGTRQNTEMAEILSSKSFSTPQDLADISAHVSSLPMTSENGKGKDEDMVRGGELYKKTCSGCHGVHAEGNALVGFPLLQSQHYGYMLGQFKAIKEGKRNNADPAMMALIQRFSDEDIRAVLDYVSRIKPPKDKRAVEQDFSSVMDQFKNH